MKKFWIKVLNFFSFHCPDCGGKMKGDGYDSFYDKVVYTCTKCHKEWI